jgi:integrase
MEQPICIPMNHDIEILHSLFSVENLKMQETHKKTAIETIAAVLFFMYGKSYSLTTLYQNSSKPEEATLFSNKLVYYATTIREWSHNTQRIVLSNLKKILKATTIDPLFTNRITLKAVKGQTYLEKRFDNDGCLPFEYKKRPDDDPSKQLLLSWVHILKEKTRNKVSSSVLRFVYFWLDLLKTMNVCVDTWSDKTLDTINKISDEMLTSIILKTQTKLDPKIKLAWGKLFINTVLELEKPRSIFEYNIPHSVCEAPKDDGTDHHRMTAEELDKIYKVAKDNPRDELIFMLFITTGLRIGGLVKIRIEDVCDIVCGDYVVRDHGKTIEKFNKWFTFKLNARVKTLVYQWLKFYKPAGDSQYLFPGRNTSNSYLTTACVRNIFNRICKNADVTGDHVHPHSLRHSFAHMLLDSGNSTEIVSKIMGHSDSSTTSKFYLKESGVEACDKANIPWLNHEKEKKNIIPNFLKPDVKKRDTTDRAKKKKVCMFKSIIEELSEK